MADLLIVEDDEDVSWMLEQLFVDRGHTVRIAADGEAGLRALREYMPELVILDVEMPVLDGPAMAYRMFVHNLGLENIPVVLMSGVFDLRGVAARVGTPYFTAKPFDIAKMMALIERALVERALPRPAQ